MKEHKLSKPDKKNVNKENLDKDYKEPKMDEEKFKNKKNLNSYEDIKLSKINKEGLDKDYEEPQIDEEKMKNKGGISSNSDGIIKCPHQTESSMCNCPMNCNCKRTGKCQHLQNVEDLKDERYDTAGKSLNDENSNIKQNEKEEGVWDKTKSVISGTIKKAKEFIPKF